MSVYVCACVRVCVQLCVCVCVCVCVCGQLCVKITQKGEKLTEITRQLVTVTEDHLMKH